MGCPSLGGSSTVAHKYRIRQEARKKPRRTGAGGQGKTFARGSGRKEHRTHELQRGRRGSGRRDGVKGDRGVLGNSGNKPLYANNSSAVGSNGNGTAAWGVSQLDVVSVSPSAGCDSKIPATSGDPSRSDDGFQPDGRTSGNTVSGQAKQVVGVNGGNGLGGRAAGANHDVANGKARSVGHSYGGAATGDRTDAALSRMTNGGEEASGSDTTFVDGSRIVVKFGPFGDTGSLRGKTDGKRHGETKQGGDPTYPTGAP